MGSGADGLDAIRVRQATDQEMLALWGYPNETSAPPTAQFFCRNIASGNALFWTLDRGDALIGELYAFLNIAEDPDFADGVTTAYLCAFRVRPEYRGQGLGHRLMDAALGDLQARGFRRATIGVSDEHNKRLYRHMGFETKIKDCFFDPCARTERMEPEPDEEGYWLLAKNLDD